MPEGHPTWTDGSLPELFSSVAAECPDRIAVVCGRQSLTYAELLGQAQHLAGRLVAAGVGRNALVGLEVTRSLQIPVAILGILMSGAAYVPLDPAYPIDRLRMMVADAGVALVVTDRDSPLADKLGCRAVLVRADEAVAGVERITVAADDPAYVIYTSGSTGRPKGCIVTHRNVLSLLAATLPLFDVGPNDRWSLFHSVNFDFSVFEMWFPLISRGTVVIVDGEAALSPEAFLRLLAEKRITVLSQVPSVFRSLLQVHALYPEPDLALRYLVFGGERVELDAVRDFLSHLPADRHPVVVNMYGITETTVHVTFKELTAEDLDGPVRSPIGVPLPHLAVELRDDQGKPVAPGEPGEMWVSGGGVAAGYLNRPVLTAARFRTEGERRYYRSGDLARMLPNGELEYLGRVDRQVKHRGFRIELEEIEATLRNLDSVYNVAVAVVTGRSGGEFLTAYVAGSDDFSAAAARTHAARLLPSHMVPSRYMRVPALPLTPSGKLDRAALETLKLTRRDDPAT